MSVLYYLCTFFALLVPQPCNELETGAIRLTHGDTLDRFSSYYSMRGRLEVCFGGQWGSVCYSYESRIGIATVACRQLNHTTSGKNTSTRE